MNKKKNIVLVTGTFDGLHPGHINFFQQAQKLGKQLVVVVARDQTVEKVKSRIPIQPESERLKAVEQLGLVDQAVLGNLEDPYQVVVEWQPDIVALGYDQTTFTDKLGQELKQRGCQPLIVRLQPYHPDKYKSSKISKNS